MQNSLAKRLGLQFSQLPDAKIETIIEPLLPTRILDFMLDGVLCHLKHNLNNKCQSIRFIIPLSGTRGRYLTLSHRWGSKHTFTLTTTSIAALTTDGIKAINIPQTYRDAIAVTLSFGYRYLWIDTLCVIQDDTDDWLRESANMSSVYSNSFCTILSHTAASDTDGFLQMASSQLGEQDQSALHSRGWIFQERILSRRILYFSSSAVIFEDTSGFYTDASKGVRFPLYADSHGPPSNSDRDDLNATPSLMTRSLLSDPKPTLEYAIANPSYWYKLIEKLSCCDLTYDWDRLPAVEGLARHFESLESDNCGGYISGLWEKTIHQGLLWHGAEPEPTECCGNSRGVPTPPSCSWGKWKGQVTYPFDLINLTPAKDFEFVPTAKVSILTLKQE